ncbi:MAG: hypothetical protein WC882_00520 [Candidatus Gracilibacteria bacterium]
MGIVEISGRPHNDKSIGRPSLMATLQVRLGELDRQRAQDFLAKNEPPELVGRDGLIRLGVDLVGEGAMDLEAGVLSTRARILGLGSRGPQILDALKRKVEVEQRRKRRGSIQVGRALMAQPETHLDRSQVEEAIQTGGVLLTEKTTIAKDGTLEIPLEDLYYVLNPRALTDERIQRILDLGKQAISSDLQVISERKNFPKTLKPREFAVGAVRIALGPYLAVIESADNHQGAFQLATRVLDGIRTTGIDVPREVALFNRTNSSLETRGLKIRVKLYPADESTKETSGKVMNSRTLRDGVHFMDILTGEEGELFSLMERISFFYDSKKSQSILIGRAGCGEVAWTQQSSFQEGNMVTTAKELASTPKPQGIKRGQGVPHVIQPWVDRLKWVGRDQHERVMMISGGLPDTETLEKLWNEGVGVFVFRDLRIPEGAFDPQGEPSGKPDIYFDSALWTHLKKLEERGARFFMTYPEMPDHFSKEEGATIPAHVRIFHRGLWVQPEEVEALEKVDTVIAMYGSNVEELDETLRPQVDQFMKNMKELFGENLAVTHGKGPGLMAIADKVAELLGIPRIGIGIQVENRGQLPNYRPQAMVDFLPGYRLVRQQAMDDLATFRVFNVGGVGTLEEIGITLCSQKLANHLITPLIFVDPKGVGGSKGEHAWVWIQKQIEALDATPKEKEGWNIPKDLKQMQLVAAHTSRYCHFVSSYDEAEKIIREFKENPMAYYKKQNIPIPFALQGVEGAKKTSQITKFPTPSWFKEEALLAA